MKMSARWQIFCPGLHVTSPSPEFEVSSGTLGAARRAAIGDEVCCHGGQLVLGQLIAGAVIESGRIHMHQ